MDLATADPNPAPVPQNSLPAINQPQAQGQVIPSGVAAQAQVASGVVLGQPQTQAQGQVLPLVPAPGQVPPGVIPGQPQPQAKHKSFLSFPRQDQSVQVSFRVTLNCKRKDKSFLWFRRQDKSLQVWFPGQPQPQVQGQVVTHVRARAPVAQGVA